VDFAFLEIKEKYSGILSICLGLISFTLKKGIKF
jgi:hypothetical protein